MQDVIGKGPVGKKKFGKRGRDVVVGTFYPSPSVYFLYTFFAYAIFPAISFLFLLKLAHVGQMEITDVWR